MPSGDARPTRPLHRAAPAAAATLLALVAIAYRPLAPLIRARFATFYLYAPFDGLGIQQWRQPLLLDRIQQYAIFLPELALAALIFAVAFRWHRLLDEGAAAVSRETTQISGLLLCVVLGAVAYGFSTHEWQRYGQPCWDGYCVYGTRLADVLRGAPSAGARLSSFLHSDYHCNSPLGPLLMALVSLGTSLSMVDAYRLVCGMASVGAVVLFARYLARGTPESRLLQVLLLLTNCALVRSFAFPQTDALVLLWSSAMFALALPFAHRPTTRSRLLLVLLGASGLFVKLSFLPLLLVAPVARAVGSLSGEKRLLVVAGRALGDALVLVGIPLALFFGFQLWAGTTGQYRRELAMTRTLDFHPLFVFEALAQVTLPSLLLLFIGRRALTRDAAADDRLLLAWLPLFFLALLVSHASGWSRYYLAPTPLLALLARHGLDRLSRTGPSLPWLFVILTAALNYLALAQRIIH